MSSLWGKACLSYIAVMDVAARSALAIGKRFDCSACSNTLKSRPFRLKVQSERLFFLSIMAALKVLLALLPAHVLSQQQAGQNCPSPFEVIALTQLTRRTDACSACVLPILRGLKCDAVRACVAGKYMSQYAGDYSKYMSSGDSVPSSVQRFTNC